MRSKIGAGEDQMYRQFQSIKKYAGVIRTVEVAATDNDIMVSLYLSQNRIQNFSVVYFGPDVS